MKNHLVKMLLKDRVILFYPLALATFPAVFLYAENTNASITLAEFIVPFAIVLLLTTLLLLLLRLIIKDSVKVSVIVSMCLVVFFAYGAIFDLVTQNRFSVAGVVIARHRYLILALAVILVAGISVTLRYKGNLAPLMQGVTVGALILVLFTVVRMVMGTGDRGA